MKTTQKILLNDCICGELSTPLATRNSFPTSRFTNYWLTAAIYFTTFCILSTSSPALAKTLLHESFDDNSLASRGWYDNTSITISNSGHFSDSTGSAEFRFLQNHTIPSSGAAIRHLFEETETIFISYYVKYSANWQGSNMSAHPHEFQLLTNLESNWAGPAESHLTAYIEQNEGRPKLAIQDTLNVDQTRVGVDLSNATENRGTAGCNGHTDGYVGDCYTWGGISRNGKDWVTSEIFFSDEQGPRYKNDWHHIQAQFSLNSIVDGKGVADGILRMWYDDELIMEHTDVLFRTAQHPNMKFNQLLIAPYIGGSGSPIEQTFWIDELTVSTTKIEITSSIPPSFPTNVTLK